MGILEVLTIVFVVLKLTGIIAWSWVLVLLPTIISVSIYVVFITGSLVILFFTKRSIDREFDDFFKND